MQNIKLIAVDLDNTFLNADSKVSARNRAAVVRAIEQGIIFVVASGRMRHRIPEDVLSIPGFRYLVSSNGASVMDLQTEEVLFEDPIPNRTVKEVVGELKKFPIYLELYHRGYAYTDQQFFSHYSPDIYSPNLRVIMEQGIQLVDDIDAFISDPRNTIDKINIPYIPPIHSESVFRILHRPEITATNSLPKNAEVNHKTANKAAGLRFVCQKLNIDPSDVMAFGDAENDVEMMHFAGHSVAMGNACQEVKTSARYVTKTNAEDGVAWFLENHVLR